VSIPEWRPFRVELRRMQARSKENEGI